MQARYRQQPHAGFSGTARSGCHTGQHPEVSTWRMMTVRKTSMSFGWRSKMLVYIMRRPASDLKHGAACEHMYERTRLHMCDGMPSASFK